MQGLLDQHSVYGSPEALTILAQSKQRRKEDIKNILEGKDLRETLAGVDSCYLPPQDVWSKHSVILNAKNTLEEQKTVRKYAAVFTGDFYRNYEGPCYLCPSSNATDNTYHLLSADCKAASSPKAQEAWANILQILKHINPDSQLLNNPTDHSVTTFILNPTNRLQGQNAVTEQELISTGLDHMIRVFVSVLVLVLVRVIVRVLVRVLVI